MAIEAQRLEFDILWKDIIELFIEEFVEFFMPDLYPKIDFTEKPIFKDKELDKIFGDGKPKDVRRCDKLVQLYLKDGDKCWILAHVEVQKELSNDLPKRMFRYFYRIFDRYEEDSDGIEAIAILLAKVGKKNMYSKFTSEFNKTKLTYNYRTYGLFEANEEELTKNKNPFSIVILASRYAIQYKNDEQNKASFKFKLARLAFERSYEKRLIVQLLTFIYYVINLLDNKNEIEFENEVKLKLGVMESRSLTFQEGQHIFLSKVFGYDFDINAYIPKDQYNIAIKETQQARKKVEQEQKKVEQIQKIVEQERLEKEQAKKENEQAREENEQVKKEKEQVKKENELVKKETEQAKKEKEQTLINSVIAFYKKEFLPEEIAEALIVDLQTVISIIEKHEIEVQK